ncbi:MAG: protein kinase [Deltaproteobacteria bacterium]|nr:protein kinase [Deltaproteobacteria bacterium]
MAARTKSSTFAFTESDMPVRFGRYLLIKRKSADAIGEQFLAVWGVDEGVDQLRMIRGIYPSVAEESKFVALFSEEARALSRLANANVVRVMEVDTEAGIPFVACEHVEGVTLERLLDLTKESKKDCPWDLAVHIAAELLRGLDYVHRREDVLGRPMSMRHGDVRPTNVLISFDGEVKLTNFGSALYFIADEKTNARVQTYRGIYAPPEAGGVDEATVAGDLWGVAAILSTLLKRHETDALDSWQVEPSAVPRESIDAFLARALNKDPEERYADAAGMREVLLQIMKENASGHPPDDLAAWTKELGHDDRETEGSIVRKMLEQDVQLSLGETADGGRLGPGTVLDDRYHLLRLLGEGGMGLVFEAEHLGIGRHVAIKVLHDRILDDDVAVERFRREARITGSLGHPNIIEVSDFGVTVEGHHYMVMDLLEGESLGERIQQGAIDPWELGRIMLGICEGLDAAHRAGVIHRDLKPENIFLTSRGPRILDFGIAKRSGLDEEEQGLTRTGHICGTAEYLAPEQVRGKEPDLRGDIYSVGVMLYEALTLETPFRGRTVGETLHKVMSDRVVPPRKRSGNASIPRMLEAICMKSLARAPEKRFTTAAGMAEMLSVFLKQEQKRNTGGQPPGYSRPRGPLFWIALAAVVALCIVAIVVFVGLGGAVTRSIDDIPEIAIESEPMPVKQVAPDVLRDAAPAVVVLDKPKEEPDEKPTLKAPPKAEKPEPASAPEKDTGAEKKDRARDLVASGDRELKKLNVSKAAELYEKALLIDPRIPQAWYGLGRASFEQGNFKDAADKISYALRVSPGRTRWRIFLGNVYMTMGDRTKAIVQWQRVLKTEPENKKAKAFLQDVGALNNNHPSE